MKCFETLSAEHRYRQGNTIQKEGCLFPSFASLCKQYSFIQYGPVYFSMIIPK